MKGYVVVLCLALATGSWAQQLPGAPSAAAAASVGEGGAAAAASVDAGGASASAGGAAPGGPPGGPPSGPPQRSANQMVGETLVAGADLGNIGATGGFRIAQTSMDAANLLGGPFAQLFTRPGRIGTDLGEAITGLSLDMTRQFGQFMMSDQMPQGGLLANKLNRKINRLQPNPPAVLGMAGGDPMMAMLAAGGPQQPFDPSMLMAAGGMPQGVDPSMLMAAGGGGEAAAATAVAG